MAGRLLGDLNAVGQDLVDYCQNTLMLLLLQAVFAEELPQVAFELLVGYLADLERVEYAVVGEVYVKGQGAF